MSNTPRIDRIQQKSLIRQTVLTGPVDSNGKANFLEAGTGLQAITTLLDTTPLAISIGQGFKNGYQEDLTLEIDGNLEWNGLLASQSKIFLYIDVNSIGNISTGSTLLEPIYSVKEPSVPAEGQFWYPTDHRSKGKVFSGGVWLSVNRVFVGEVSTNVTDVVTSANYLYGAGRGNEAPLGSGQRWRNVISERAKSVTYENDTGRSIELNIYAGGDPGINSNIEIFDNRGNGQSYQTINNYVGNIRCIVPSGSSYRLGIGSGTVFSWWELR